jgi:short-subunit dehydrogenase
MSKNTPIVVVTGASSGIGTALSRELHKRGHVVMLVARREERLKSLQSEFESLRAGSALIRVCDLSVRKQVEDFAEELKSYEVIGLVNNAGIGSLGAFHQLGLQAELSQIELNVLTPLILTHAVTAAMCSRRSGFIINVSSIMAYQAVPYVATYAASKAFEWRHSLALRRELSDFGVKVLTLCPGPTETEFFGVAKVPGGTKTFKRSSPEVVATTCLRDLDAGRAVSIPTLTAKALVLLAMLSPTFIYTWTVKRVLKPILAKA